jgi:predicted nucleic acid-binding protein
VIVVSDASALIYLGSVEQLALLRDLFDRVLVPQQVWDEVVGTRVERPCAFTVVTRRGFPRGRDLRAALAPAVNEFRG